MTDYQYNFYRDIVPVIVNTAFKNGYNFPSAIIAQAICESNWNRSSLSSKYFNLFGMKAGTSWKGKSVNMKTKEEYNSQLVSIKDNFRAWDNLQDGIDGYFQFIQKDRYKNLKTATSPEEYIKLLKQDGWATSSSYVNTLTKILNDNNLKQYDKAVVVQKDKRPVKQAVMSLQQALNEYGNYNLKVDGIIGPLTQAAYEDYRKR